MQSSKGKTRVRWIASIVIILLVTAFGNPNTQPQSPKFKYGLGDIPLDPATYQRHLKTRSDTELLEALPTSYDARDEGLVTPAKDQGSCGSCWAFASVGAMESHMLKQYGVGPTDDFSEQQQVSCNRSMSGCNGGSALAIQYWQARGPLYETCFPYTAIDTTACIEDQCAQIGFHVVDYYTVPTTPQDFKASLYNDGPSYWRFTVLSDFYDYWERGTPGEVYVHSEGTFEGGHAVLLIGWDDVKEAYLCKNSWGDGGPNSDGTFWIAYSGHASDLGFGMANFSLEAEVCASDTDCDDGLYCTGAERCVTDVCLTGVPPICSDDGLFCNGSELCDELNDACGHSGTPCVGETECIEELDVCEPLHCGNGTCELGENCTNCPDDCVSAQNGSCDACFKGKCDGTCNPAKEDETCADCVLNYCCGNGVCEDGESVSDCALDCTACVPAKKACDCDGVCEKPERTETCPWDCP